MPRLPVTRSATLTRQQASILAVQALDDLVHELVRAKRLQESPGFLDWVADEATPLVERCVERAFSNPRFAASLKMGEPRIAMARWVRHWVCPWIVIHFDDFVAHLPEFADSRPAALNGDKPGSAVPAQPWLAMAKRLPGVSAAANARAA